MYDSQRETISEVFFSEFKMGKESKKRILTSGRGSIAADYYTKYDADMRVYGITVDILWPYFFFREVSQ